MPEALFGATGQLGRAIFGRLKPELAQISYCYILGFHETSLAETLAEQLHQPLGFLCDRLPRNPITGTAAGRTMSGLNRHSVAARGFAGGSSGHGRLSQCCNGRSSPSIVLARRRSGVSKP
jgi:hypothetical protein